MLATILSSREVILFSGVDKTFPACDLSLIRTVERREFRECIGNALYEELKTLQVDYSAVLEYAPASTYLLDALVSFQGVVYKAKQAVPVNSPPPTVTYWDLAPKFSSECAQDMWCDYLAEYLSLAVVLNHLPRLHAQVAAEGVVQRTGTTYLPASDKAYNALYASMLAIKETAWENLLTHAKELVKDTADPCYSLWALLKPLEISCCGGCGELHQDCGCGTCDTSTTISYLVG